MKVRDSSFVLGSGVVAGLVSLLPLRRVRRRRSAGESDVMLSLLVGRIEDRGRVFIIHPPCSWRSTLATTDVSM